MPTLFVPGPGATTTGETVPLSSRGLSLGGGGENKQLQNRVMNGITGKVEGAIGIPMPDLVCCVPPPQRNIHAASEHKGKFINQRDSKKEKGKQHDQVCSL